MKGYETDENVLGRKIEIIAADTGMGISVLLAGGDFPHIGAVSIVDSEGNMTTSCFQGHKDTVISEKWTRRLWQEGKVPATVSVGIHYDNATEEMINKVLEATDRMLENLLMNLRQK